MQIFIACFNITQNKIDYFSNKNITLSVLKASAAIPVFYGKKISIDDNKYTDHPFSPYQLIQDNKEKLAEKIIMIDVLENNFLHFLLCKFFWARENRKVNEDVLVIAPKNIKAHLLTRSTKTIEKTFDQGYLHAIDNKELIKDFLKQ